MPHMSKFESTLLSLEARSTEYADKATQLSNLLGLAEDFLRKMPGKFELSAHDDYGKLVLRRTGSNDWRLQYLDTSEPHLPDEEPEYVNVTEARVEIKAHAAILLPKLIEKLLSGHDERLALVNKALSQLKTIPFLDLEGA